MQETVVTCHECQMQHVFHAIEEWPPKIFICSNCDSTFMLDKVSTAGEPIFTLYGYCRYEQ